MMRREAGFTLIELLITMVIFVIVIAAGSQIFTGLLVQFKQQSKAAETNIEGIVGLEILRQDIEHAGYGLPWVIPAGVTYQEATTAPASTYNDASNPPRALISGNNVGTNGSDYLVVKAVNVGENTACQKWTILKESPFTSPYNPRVWSPTSENLDYSGENPYVTLLSTGTTSSSGRVLINNGATFSTRFSTITSSPWPPPTTDPLRIVYGIDPDTNPWMPFNRADYYISIPAANMPQQCASNTGILYKNVLRHSDGAVAPLNQRPLIDCVANMQVIYGMDTNNDSAVNCYTNNLADVLGTFDALNVRNQVKEVRVYILAHEGQRDVNYTFTNFTAGACATCVRVGESSASLPFGSCTGESVLGLDFDLITIPNWQNYRWKVYTLVVKPNNIR